jgi:phosphoribosylanthranilate isomerase
MIIKICGLMDYTNVKQVDTLLPDFIGMIFHSASPRNIGENILPKTRAAKVGVFVDGNVPQIIANAQRHELKYIQLHGHQDVSVAKDLHKKGYKIIKTFHIGHTMENESMEKYTSYADYFLFDTKGKYPGGNGLQFNWVILDDYRFETPFLLSGGIGPSDIESIKRISHPAFAGIDINSRFEIEPGLKNTELLKPFIHAFR